MKISYARHHVVRLLSLATLTALVVVACGLSFDGLTIYNEEGEEVQYGEVGKKTTFVVKADVDPKENIDATNLVICMLVPRGWQLAANADVTYTVTRYSDDATHHYPMSVIPETSLPKNGNGMTWSERLFYKYGIGTNVLDDMEWVSFQSDDSWGVISSQAADITFYITTTVGVENLKCKLGFVINHTNDGLSGNDPEGDHTKIYFTDYCFEVVGGDGPVTDFCNNHYNKVAPMSSLQNDFVTFTFNSDAADNQLAGGDVYLQGTAYGASGKTYTIDEKNEKTRMRPSETGGKDYNLLVWPADYFNVPADEELLYIDYFFTNADGSVVIGQSEDDYDQYGTALPAQSVPFRFTFGCK